MVFDRYLPNSMKGVTRAERRVQRDTERMVIRCVQGDYKTFKQATGTMILLVYVGSIVI